MDLNADNLPQHSVFNKTKFTCQSCRIAFPSQDMQRVHMKTEWHRYNLKRRVAQLAPIDADLFESKVQHQPKQISVDEFGFPVDKLTKERGQDHLKAKKLNPHMLSMLSRNARLHLNDTRENSPARSEISKFSIGSTVAAVTSGSELNESEEEDDVDIDEDDHYVSSHATDIDQDTDEELDEEPIFDFELDQCFYCGMNHDSIEENVDHMFKNHGLYLPDIEKLILRDDMLRVIGDSIGIDRICLRCGYQSNKLIGIRQHIRSKGHASIPYETQEEKELWSAFYLTKEDFSDDDEIMEDSDSDESTSVALIEGENLPDGSKLTHRSMIRFSHKKYHHKPTPNENTEPETGDGAITLVDEKSKQVLHLRQVLVEKAEAKRLARADMQDRSRELSKRGLKYRNKLLHYRNQYL